MHKLGSTAPVTELCKYFTSKPKHTVFAHSFCDLRFQIELYALLLQERRDFHQMMINPA